jgi:Ran GTPase-activating protein (RanGAP) involved in mRNA processing and transport
LLSAGNGAIAIVAVAGDDAEFDDVEDADKADVEVEVEGDDDDEGDDEDEGGIMGVGRRERYSELFQAAH